MVDNLIKKTLLASLLFFLCAILYAADPASRAESAKTFAEEIQRSLPFTSLMTLAWSDSYTGQLISRRPHFGAGLTYGMSTAGFSAARELLNGFDADGYMNMTGVFMPPLYAHVRIGGFFVPFDIGFVASIPVYARSAEEVESEQQTFGGDIRFALVRDSSKMPGVSLGIAYTQTAGSLSTRVSGTDVGIYWNAGAIEIKTQISKTFQTITPYFGAGGSYTWSQAGYEASGALVEKWIMEPENYANGMLFRIFGGASIKLWALRLDLSMHLSITDVAYGAVAGLRFQL